MAVLLCSIPASAQDNPTPAQSELTNKGMQAYQDGHPAKCLEFLGQATQLYPRNQAARLNYGSMAYQIALELKRHSASEDIWKGLSLIVVAELSEAILIGKDVDNEASKRMTGHAAFLLGDMWHYLYDKPELARDYFEFAKHYWPDNPNLIREIEVVNQKIDKNYVPQPLNLYLYSVAPKINSK